MTTLYVQSPTLYLAGSGVIIGATSVTLTSLTDIYGNVLTMSDFGSTGYITFEPDTTNAEAATFTGVTANANGTYTLTGVKTLLAKSPYTETSGLVRQHSGGTKVVVTDNVGFWNTFVNKNNPGTITAVQTFSSGATPVIIDAPVNPTDAANKGYIDGVAIAGGVDASTTTKGISKMSVAPVSATNPIAVGQNDPQFVNYFAETGAANAYVLTPSPSIGAYAVGQRFSFKATNANTTTSTLNINALGAKTIKKLGGSTDLVNGDIAAGMIVSVEYDGTNFIMLNPVANAPALSSSLKFGGTGADGALTISSGTTNIDLAGARQVIKNYTSISITGTGALTFTNPHASGTIIILKSQGAVTITSSTNPAIDLRNLGASASTNGTSYSVIPKTGTSGSFVGVGGLGHGNGDVGIGNKGIFLSTGAGGATAVTGGNSVAGRGAGALYIECAGAYTCSSTINATGTAATTNTASPGGNITWYSAGGGANKTDGGAGSTGFGNAYGNSGSGAGGCYVCIYGSLVSDTGTYSVTGGTNTAGASAGVGGIGGDGFSLRVLNTEFV